jgi:hypothetical protein
LLEVLKVSEYELREPLYRGDDTIERG